MKMKALDDNRILIDFNVYDLVHFRKKRVRRIVDLKEIVRHNALLRNIMRSPVKAR